MAGVERQSEQRPEPAEDADEAVDLFRAIGKQVKLLRERAGLTQRELGDRLGYGEDQISSPERGRRITQPEFLDAADDLLDAGGLLKAAKGRRGPRQGQGAGEAPGMVPGLRPTGD